MSSRVARGALPRIKGVARSIDHSSAVPFYYQLQEILREDLDNGRWNPGDLIPSEAELAAIFGVSRTVIRKALDILEGEGSVVRVKGKGTVVALPKLRYEAIAEPGMWKKAWHTLPSLHTVIDVRQATSGGHLGKVLRLASDSLVFEVTYTQAIEGTPASLSQTFIRQDATPALGSLAEKGDLPQFVKQGPDFLTQLVQGYGVHVLGSEVSIEAAQASDFESDLLGIPIHTPVFVLSSIDFGPENNPVAFTRTAVRSDFFRFSVVIRLDLRPSKPGVASGSKTKRDDRVRS